MITSGCAFFKTVSDATRLDKTIEPLDMFGLPLYYLKDMFACVAGMFLKTDILPSTLHVANDNCKLGKASNILGFVLRAHNAGPFSIPQHLVIPKIYTSVCNSDGPVSLEAQFRIVSS